MNRPIARYRSSRRYAVLALVALLGVIPSAWASRLGIGAGSGWLWVAAAISCAVMAAFTLVLALRPRIDVFETYFEIGKRRVFWAELRGVDRIAVGSSEPWTAPLLLRLTLAGGDSIMIFHAGDVDSCVSLLRHIYRNARAALLDGISYADFWGETPAPERPAPSTRPRMLLAEDEEEIERMFQRLKASGQLDTPAGADQAAGPAGGSQLDPHRSDES